MHKYLIICGLFLFFGCKNDQKKYEQEMVEVTEDSSSNSQEQLTSTDELLDVPEIHQGTVESVDGKYVIMATAFIDATLKEDYNNISNVKELFPETFKITAKKTGDTPASNRDSVITMQYKTSFIEFRKRSGVSDQLLIASLKDENFLLQNGLHAGMDREETLAKFGITQQIQQDIIEVLSADNSNKIILFMKKDTLVKIEIIPSNKG
jgi:hypothetical protein